MIVKLLIIDGQTDFLSPTGALSVRDADQEATRVAAMIKRAGNKIDEIIATLDCHNIVDIAHPIWWVDTKGNHPTGYTPITGADMDSGKWTTTKPSLRTRTRKYLADLEATPDKYTHMVWPEHCIIGTEGNQIFPPLLEAYHDWERTQFATVDKLTKGSNPYVEHFSPFKAEVIDPKDQSTELSVPLIDSFAECDYLGYLGWAGSHCAKFGALDIVNNFTDKSWVKKMVVLEDALAAVTGFEQQRIDFINEMRSRGAQISTTKDFLS